MSWLGYLVIAVPPMVFGTLLYHYPEKTYARSPQEPYVEDPSLTDRGVGQRRLGGLLGAVFGLLVLGGRLLTSDIPTLNTVFILSGTTVVVFPEVGVSALEGLYIPASKPVVFVLGLAFAFGGVLLV